LQEGREAKKADQAAAKRKRDEEAQQAQQVCVCVYERESVDSCALTREVEGMIMSPASTRSRSERNASGWAYGADRLYAVWCVG
jgi:hypothetical protein